MARFLCASVVLFNAVLCCCFARKHARFEILNLEPDSEHDPFLHGVSSGDPLFDRVLIWTRITTQIVGDRNLKWALWEKDSLNQSFDTPFASGTGNATLENDYTFTVDVIGLYPNTKYFYQFEDQDGNRSIIGTTRTLPDGNTNRLNIAVTSCTKVQAGYLNAYRHISKQEDIAFVAHMGDYIYPQLSHECHRYLLGVCDNRTEFNWFQKCKEFHSATNLDNGSPFLNEFASTFTCSGNTLLERSRWVHALYLLDPDLRAARKAHPFLVQFDNHDASEKNPEYKGELRAFLEWIPTRYTLMQDNLVNTSRHFQIGDLADLVILDTQSFRDKNNESLLGLQQEGWFEKRMANSSATWRLIGSPKMLVPYSLNGYPPGINVIFAIISTLFLVPCVICCGLEQYKYHRKTPPSSVKIDETDDENKKDVIIHYEVQESVENPKSKFKSHRCYRAFSFTCEAHKDSPRYLQLCTICGVTLLIIFLLVWIILGTLLATLPILTSDEADKVVYLDDGKDAWGGNYNGLKRMFQQLENHEVDYNNIWLTGDMHFTVFGDVVDFNEDDFSTLLDYDPAAMNGKTNKRYGVEFLPTSGTSPNIDERIELVLGWDARASIMNKWITDVIEWLTLRSNPHFRFFNGRDHGYGILRMSKEKVVAEVYYHDKYVLGDEPKLSVKRTIYDQENCWD